MSETKTFPDFHQDLTREPDEETRPEINDEEKAESVRLFNQAFDHCLSRYQQGVRHEMTEDGRQIDQLMQKIQTGGQAYVLTVVELGPRPFGGLADTDTRPSEDFSRLINLQLIVDNRPGDLSSYRLSGDGVVRRYDVDAEANHLLQRMAKSDIQSATSDDEARQRLIDSQENYVENVRFEEDMGVNNQPVRPEEVDGLGKFLEQVSRPNQPRQKHSPYL